MFLLTFATLALDQILMGATAIAFGVLMAYGGFWYRRRLRLIEETPLVQVRDLKEGPAKVKGRVVAMAEALHSPMLKKPCVYYKFWVLGNKWALATGSTLVLDSDCIPCAVDDGTGSVMVNLAEGELGLAVDRHTTSGPLGPAAPDLVRLVEQRYGVRGRGISTSYKETLLEEGDSIVVVGQVRRTRDGRWSFFQGKREPVIVWDHTDEQLTSKYSTWVKTCWILTALAVLGGILLIILALFGVDVSPAARSG